MRIDIVEETKNMIEEFSLFPEHKSKLSWYFLFYLWGMWREWTSVCCSLRARQPLSMVLVVDSACIAPLLPLLIVGDICVKVAFFSFLWWTLFQHPQYCPPAPLQQLCWNHHNWSTKWKLFPGLGFLLPLYKWLWSLLFSLQILSNKPKVYKDNRDDSDFKLEVWLNSEAMLFPQHCAFN